MKSYQQLCGIAKALDIIGDRWTLLILRDLLLGPLHYGELSANLVGITSNLLADRLRDLQEQGLVEKTGKPNRASYQLTAAGRSVEPVLFALGQWGWNFIDPTAPDVQKNLRWAMVSLKRRLRAQALDYTLLLDVPGHGTYAVWEKDAKVQVEARSVAAADCVVRGKEEDILQAIARRQATPWEKPTLHWEGNREVWSRMILHLDA